MLKTCPWLSTLPLFTGSVTTSSMQYERASASASEGMSSVTLNKLKQCESLFKTHGNTYFKSNHFVCINICRQCITKKISSLCQPYLAFLNHLKITYKMGKHFVNLIILRSTCIQHIYLIFVSRDDL